MWVERKARTCGEGRKEDGERGGEWDRETLAAVGEVISSATFRQDEL